MIEATKDPREALAGVALHPATVVEAGEDGLYRVRLATGDDAVEVWATHALPTPAPCAVGRRVLVALDRPDAGYVIGVLDQGPGAERRIAVGSAVAEACADDDGDRLELRDDARRLCVTYDPVAGTLTLSPAATASLRLAAPEGDIALAAGQRLRLRAGKATELETARLTVSARRALLTLAQVSVYAESVNATVRRLRQTAERIEVTAGRILERAGSVYRRATRLYRQRAGRLHLSAAESADLRGERVELRARRDVKLDGEKIRLG